MGLVLSRLSEEARSVRRQDAFVITLHGTLKTFKAALEHTAPREVLEQLITGRQAAMKMAKEAGQLDRDTRDLKSREILALQQYRTQLVEQDVADDAAFETVKGWFGEQVALRKELAQQTSAMFDNAFAFLETTFAQGQELVMFVTEITAGADMSWFVENFGCEAYFRHNKELLFDQTQQRIRDSILEAKE
jgi:hypothetical protein